MEKLDRIELLLVKGCVLSEKRQLEVVNEELTRKQMSDIDVINYSHNQKLINDYSRILEKLVD